MRDSKQNRLPRWYERIVALFMFLSLLAFTSTIAYFIMRHLFSAAIEWHAFLAGNLIAFILNLLMWTFLMYVRARLMGRSEDIFQRRVLFETLEALDRIARGDFKVLIDSTDRGPYSDLAARVNHMAQELDSMEQQRQDFISNVSHEIQSPLTSISGFAALLKRGGLEAEQVTRYADIIESESKRLSKLSDNLLRLSVLESTEDELKRKAYRIDKQIESLLLLLEPQWSEKEIVLDVDLPKTTYFGDADLLSQVFVNLFHNAIKYTPQNGALSVQLAESDHAVVCTVSDSGVGISEADQMHIFERFFKADKARDRSLGGNGLGLSIVKKIVDLHGGTVSVRSALGSGTTFTVFLPKVDV